MNDELLTKILATNNYAVFDGYAKAQAVIQRHDMIVCSISGGSDSDLVLDMIHNVDEHGKVTYFWIDTGLEYQATKEHLDDLEQKYGIEIKRIKPDKPIPACVKQYGVPFLSKYVSEQIMRLQAHHFQWEDEPLEVLLKKYPKCKTALQWWCGERYSDENGIETISRFSITRNRFLKEFIIANPPDFPISNKCCEYAKKKPAKRLVKEMDADLDITGIRKAEGGIRSANFKTCFSENTSKGCDTYRPIFWYTESDKKVYEEHFGIQHSRCYTEYGLRRTGCVGCPFSKHINEELAVIEQYEPNLYKAAVNLLFFGYDWDRYLVELDNGTQFTVKQCDSKGLADDGEGKYHYFGGSGKCMIEFIYDDYSLPSCVAFSGSWGYYNWNGLDLGANIKSIKKINYGDTVEY